MRLCLFLAIAGLTMIASLGCLSEPELSFDPPIEEYEPPVAENLIVISVVHAPDHSMGFRVYAGRSLTPESELVAETTDQLKSLIATHVEYMVAANTSLDGVLIECDGNVRTGCVKIVKSGVYQSDGQSERNLYVSFREQAKINE